MFTEEWEQSNDCKVFSEHWKRTSCCLVSSLVLTPNNPNVLLQEHWEEFGGLFLHVQYPAQAFSLWLGKSKSPHKHTEWCFTSLWRQIAALQPVTWKMELSSKVFLVSPQRSEGERGPSAVWGRDKHTFLFLTAGILPFVRLANNFPLLCCLQVGAQE